MASIEPFIHRKVVVLRQDATVEQAAHAMCERAVGCVVVSDLESHVVGIVTDRDLACQLLAGSQQADLPIARVMTAPVVSAKETDELEHVIQLMETHGIRRIPVVQSLAKGRQKCIGIVTLDDLITSKSISDSRLIRIIKAQLRKRLRQDRQRIGSLKVSAEAEGLAPEFSSTEDFYREVSRRSDLEKMGWDADQSREVTRMFLGTFVKRLHHTGAMHLITLLPDSIQEELMELPSGPDRSISADSIVLELGRRFNLDSAKAYAVSVSICRALDELLDYEQLGHVKAQLPQDMRAFFDTKEAAA